MLLFRKSVHCRRAENCLLNASACVEEPKGNENGRQAIEKTGLAERKEHLVFVALDLDIAAPGFVFVAPDFVFIALWFGFRTEKKRSRSPSNTPLFHGLEKISDLAFLGQYGTVLNIGDLAQRD